MKNTALITGASSGIGKEIAYIHAKNWWDLVLIARSKNTLNEIKKDIQTSYKVSVYVIVKDLIRETAASEIYNELKKENIEIEYLINNAGFWGIGKFYEREWLQDKNMILLNIIALSELTRLFLPDFVVRNTGRILNVSSTASLLPWPNQAVYFATKAFVSSFSDAIGEELYDTNVTVTSLLPWPTQTWFGEKSGMNKTKMFQNISDAERVAKAWYEAMLKGKRSVIAWMWLWWKMLMNLVGFIPKSIVLPIIRKAQEKTQ